MARAVLITGSNAGDRTENLARAAELIGQRAGEIAATSSIAETEPWGDVRDEDGSEAGRFLNQVVVVETGLLPEELLDVTQGIEKELGRGSEQRAEDKKAGRYRSRTMDVDILFYDDMVIETGRLVVPHPMMARRRFVLEPLAEIMPRYRHPALGRTVAEMLEAVGR